MVITGGSRGIGRATALAAATRGFRVVVGYASNETAAKEVVSSIEQKNGKAVAVRCDVASENDILALFRVADDFGTRRPNLREAPVHAAPVASNWATLLQPPFSVWTTTAPGDGETLLISRPRSPRCLTWHKC